jgi:hypothetical protein
MDPSCGVPSIETAMAIVDMPSDALGTETRPSGSTNAVNIEFMD